LTLDGGPGRYSDDRPSRRRETGDSGEAAITGRVPPSDLSAEKAVLSSILLDNNAIHVVITEVREEDFYHPAHQILYGAMSSSATTINPST